MPDHPLHTAPRPQPVASRPVLHPGGRPLPVCTPAEWSLISLDGDDVVDLPGQFFGAAELGERLAVWPNGLTDWPRYTDTADNRGGTDNHFQGFQRLRVPGYAVISGGDPHKPKSHLFVMHLASRGAAPMWGSNLLLSSLPPAEDLFVSRIDLHATLWHAGGMALLGDVLAIPIENSDAGGSRVEFLDLRDPDRPTDLACGIARPAVKAGAVALTRMDDDRFLVAVWSDSELEGPDRHLDFYFSTGTSLLGTGWTGPFCVTDEVKALPKYQTIALLWNLDELGERTDLYLLGLENGAKTAPDPAGPNYGHLYHVLLPTELGGFKKKLELLSIEPPKLFQCAASFADMDAASGVYRSPTGVLGIYCAHHHVRRGDGNKFLARFQEYMSTGPSIGVFPPSSLGDSRIELYDLADFAGDPLLLLSGQARIDDLDTVQVHGQPFARRISSVRCILPAGFAFVLYREYDQKGPNPLVIEGGSAVVEIPDLGAHQFSDAALSCAVVALRAARQLEDATWFPSA